MLIVLHFIEKANGIAHEYAWLDKHPDVFLMVGKRSLAKIVTTEL